MSIRPLKIRRHNRGDKCECAGCAGKLTVGRTIVNRSVGVRTWYLYCDECRWAPEDNKIVFPLALSPPRDDIGNFSTVERRHA